MNQLLIVDQFIIEYSLATLLLNIHLIQYLQLIRDQLLRQHGRAHDYLITILMNCKDSKDTNYDVYVFSLCVKKQLTEVLKKEHKPKRVPKVTKMILKLSLRISKLVCSIENKMTKSTFSAVFH